MKQNNKNNRHYSLRIKLEKLKQTTWLLVILARVLVFLVNLAYDYLKRA